MSSIRSKIEFQLARLAARAGIFVARYRPNYKYVPKEAVIRAKLIPKKPVHAHPPFNTLDDDKFHHLADEVIESGRTFLGKDRLFTLWQAVRNVYRMRLPAAEVGSFRGGSAYFLASAFLQMAGKELPMFIFDTFEGHPASKVGEQDPSHFAGKFADTDYQSVKMYLSQFRELEIYKGEFSETICALPEMTYGLVHIDVDLYQTTLDCLEYFGSRLAPGGVIILDDYSSPTCLGVDQAVTEYLARTDNFCVWHPLTEQLVLQKR